MNTVHTPNGETRSGVLRTADLAASANRPERLAIEEEGAPREPALAPLFAQGTAGDYRAHWNVVQQGFVDDPHAAVRQADELVAQVIKSLAETFATQRDALEGESGSTEDLRLALRRYRSFFDRLLSI